ncbi:MAG: TRAP transporter large permease [Lentisphaeria bacterium]|nr:TRAP transporter large permease [Lentisphaeria bacterium]
MTPLQIGILGCILMVVLLLSSMPVGFVMAVVGGLGFLAVTGNPHAAGAMMVNELHGVFGSHGLTVIPLFILMGQVAFHSGLSRRLFEAAYRWLGPLPGGLAMATVGACTGFGAICGSGPATAATMAAVALPEMRRRGYSMELATGAVAAGGSLGMLIPPSVVFIVYGIMTEQSPEKLFIAGIMPGLMIAALFCVTIYLLCTRRPALGPPAEPFTLRQKLAALGGIVETLILFTMVIGGMFFGWFTPTEAAAAGAAGSIVLALLKRRLAWAGLQRALIETVRTSCMVMVIVAGALMFGRFLAITRIPVLLAQGLSALPLPAALVMAGIVGFYLVAGCFVDALALVLLTIPIFDPVVRQLGFDPVWFGVMIVVITQMGVISPPVGVNVYVVSGIERDVPLQTVFRGALPFLGALVVSAGLLIAFPAIALFLPEHGPRALRFLAAVALGIAFQSLAIAIAGRLSGSRLPAGRSTAAAVATTALLVMGAATGSAVQPFGGVWIGLGVAACLAVVLARRILERRWIQLAWPMAACAAATVAAWVTVVSKALPGAALP